MHWFTNVLAPILVIIGLVIFGGYIAFTYGKPYLGPFFTGEGNTIRVNNVPIRIDSVAATPETRFRGLSRREELPIGYGMLFVFDQSGYHGMTMRDMRFPLDILWVGPDMRVVHVERNLLPSSYPRVFEPSQPARFVIELNAHFAESFGLKVGDTVEIPARYVPDDL